ncbi:transposase [Rhizobium leguminosarum]|uniref:transposase n=1 Tax=Rhizobium leguminosarum TaxID=384 RepID=UPI001980AD06|nr:transposase [Rhizobium leguminosarum]NKK63720.1 transposase [Rhizobium leguminosarum bv. viciae]NKL04889.1 transposase [Rhizobium leguminosarum bv. viciae]NKL81536.1 transposase [Rhizobium leguminosarum bv. viciae]NKL91043.1 transposase [Rhizobium leguminosarum bv. viciae]NKM91073.1 transposase [Rhizobium leguminosarum bv. viciae]
MIRTDLPDRQWEKIAPHCHGKDTDPGRSGGNNRLFLEAVLWKARTNSPWRVSPASVSGASSSNFRCFQHLRCAVRLPPAPRRGSATRAQGCGPPRLGPGTPPVPENNFHRIKGRKSTLPDLTAPNPHLGEKSIRLTPSLHSSCKARRKS